MVSSVRQSLYREPLRPRAGVTFPRHGIGTHVGRRYPAFVALTGSCAGPKSSPSLGFTLGPRIFAGCCVPLLEVGPSQRYSANLSQRALDPYPACSRGALAYCFPQDNGLPGKPIRSALRICLYSNFSRGEAFGAAVIRSSSGPPICSPPRLHLPQRSRAGQPWLLRPRLSRFVTSPSRGYPSRPYIGN